MSKSAPDESEDNSVIDTKTVRTLATILKSTGLTEIEVERGDLRIRVARELTAAPAQQTYIAAPAAVRVALPQAQPTYYLTASLAITFPFNIIIGIPLDHAIARWIFGT
jgi:hypothetical protein